MIYRVYYRKIERTAERSAFAEVPIRQSDIPERFYFMATVEAETANDVFRMFNNIGHVNPLTTPDGQKLVERSKTFHTSMSVNDVLYCGEADTWLQCANHGWKTIDDGAFTEWLTTVRRLVTDLELTEPDEDLPDVFPQSWVVIKHFEAGLTPEQTAYLIQSEGI